MMKPGAILLAIGAAALFFPHEAVAQPFTQVIVFGDSNVDSGFYKALGSPGGSSTYNGLWASAVAHGAGAPTSSPDPISSQMLAAYFGLTANPSNTSGGTNYATSGAKNVTVNNAQTGGFTAAVPTVTQISNYLAAHGGTADGQALYLIYSGDNDVSYANGDSGAGPYPADPTAYVTQAANDLVTAVASLRTAGAQSVIVSGLAYDFPTNNATKRALKLTYTQTLWAALAGLSGVYLADIDTVRVAIAADQAKYGFTTISNSAGNVACSQPSGIGSAWALLCSSNPSAPSTWVSATAPQTDLFADDQHLATAGQRFMAEYFRNLVASQTASHDFGRDRKSDVLWRNTSGNLAMWLMNGTQISSSVNIAGAATSWSIVGQRDFNGDGKADVLWHDASGDVAMWLMNGGSIARVASLGNVSPAWSVAGTGDFNSDSKGDILWRNTNGGVAMWLMNGTRIASSVNVANVSTSWSIVGASGNTIFWRNANGNVAVWQMKGASIASSATIGNMPTTWSIAGTGDFDGDGFADILWHDTTGHVAIWLLDSSGHIASTAALGPVATAWSVAETGDYNGDGKTDVLWRHTGGTVAMWLMNGGSISSSVNIRNVAAVWSIQGAHAD